MDLETGERFTGPTTLEDYPQPYGKIPAFVGGTGVLVHDDGDGLVASVYPVAEPGSEYEFVAPDGETRSTVTTPARAWTAGDVRVVDAAGETVDHTVDPTTGAVTFALTPGVGYRLVDLAVEDGSAVAPAVGVLSHDNGWDTGLRDGDYTVSMDLWWGENAREVRLYENGVLVGTQDLTMASPGRQHAEFAIAGRPNGTYLYTAELENSRGVTPAKPVTVDVTDASPATPVLSHDNWDGDGAYTVAADLWWGTNATSWSLAENGVVIGEGSLAAATPQAQHVSFAVSGRAPGDHEYVITFGNPLGATSSRPLTVRVQR
jgi:arabinogalactan endo-1,4-beta-galactosidase